MKAVRALIWKEWRQTVDTPLGYVIAVAFLLAAGFFFGNRLFLAGQADMRDFFAMLPVLLMFFVPAVGMRSLADERKAGTFELLATMPVTTWQIVAGKYLALLLQWGVLLALTLFYPATLAMLGDPDGGQIAASYLAAALLTGVYAAICLFASSLTNNGVVAYVLGFSMLLAVFLLAQAAPLLSPAMQNWLELVNPLARYQGMLRGVVHLDDAVWLASLTAVFLAATHLQLERRRWQ